ncbi:MAG: HAMP domain-containing histidine kinase [Clostridia bacterium]|nr:HAMP domain-containing histidine kinase [Clostridia bacterium]
MTSKKIGRLIKAGILIFFIISEIIGIFAIIAIKNVELRSSLNSVTDEHYMEELAEHFDEIKIETKEDSDYAAKLYLQYYSIKFWQSVKYPYVLSVCDAKGNMTFAANNFLYKYRSGHNDIFISLDEYLTDDIRKELKKLSKYGSYIIKEAKLHYDGEKYIPVEISFQLRKSIIDYEKEYSIKFTDYETNEVIAFDGAYDFFLYLNEVKAPFYHRHYFDELKERIKPVDPETVKAEYFGKDFFVAWVEETGSVRGSGDLAVGEGYLLQFRIKYNPVLDAVFSEDFQFITFFLAVFFAIAGIILYSVCMNIITKNEKLEEAKSTFISAASHELKTPLAVIQNQCECIIENIAPEKNGEYVSSIYDEAVRMNSIVTSLLSYNKISQLTDIKKERCNLSELLKEEVKRYRRFAEKEGASIEESIADEIYISCNAPLMKMAIDNYLSNAVKYAVGDKKITVSLSENRGVFNLTVMNPAERESVNTAQESWREFSRGDKSRQRKGTSVGMGLPICKKIFELHSFSGFCKYSEGKVSFVIIG